MGEGEHGDVFVVVVVPVGFVDDPVELVDQVSLIFRLGGFLFVVITPIRRVEPADIVLAVDLVIVQHHNHAFLDGLFVLVEEKQEVDFVVGDRVANRSRVLVSSL